MQRCLLFALLTLIVLATCAPTQDLGGAMETSTAAPHSQRLWITSIVAAAAATSFDAATSWGKLESNSVLASRNGTFGTKGIGIKVGLQAGLLIPQIWLRKHRELRTAFVVGNFAEAGIYSAAAVHNLGIPRPNR